LFRTPPRNLDSRTTITIDEQTFVVEADDLEAVSELGRGAYGIVEKMKHRPTATEMAVKVSIFLTNIGMCMIHKSSYVL